MYYITFTLLLHYFYITFALHLHYIEWCIYSGPDINLDGDEDDDDSQRPGPSGAANGHQKARTSQQKAGEGMLKRILEEVEGECYSFR